MAENVLPLRWATCGSLANSGSKMSARTSRRHRRGPVEPFAGPEDFCDDGRELGSGAFGVGPHGDDFDAYPPPVVEAGRCGEGDVRAVGRDVNLRDDPGHAPTRGLPDGPAQSRHAARSTAEPTLA
jgi:hypothetical protein